MIANIRSFQPPSRVLMGPGPSDVHARVLGAMARPEIGHLDPAFQELMEELKALLRYAFQTNNQLTLPLSAPGSAGMEACVINLAEPGDKVVVCVNGVFGQRMLENVKRCGAIPIPVEFDWGQPVDSDVLEHTLQQHPDSKIVAMVHAETSTGVRSDVAALAAIARQFGCLTLVDAVTSLGGIPLLVDEWQLDAVYSGSQKCLSCTPGLSPLTFSEKALEKIRGRKTPVQSWFLDLNLVLGYWGEGKRAYHHTAPINPLYGLHEALVMLGEEGLENSWARHQLHHTALVAGLEAMGLTLQVEKEWRLPQLNAVLIPDGVDDALSRKELLEKHGLEIGAGLGAAAGKVWRVGLMGNSAHRKNVLHCLASLEDVLKNQGIETSSGLRQAEAIYQNQ